HALAGDLNAAAGRREFQPVIHAAQVIAFDAPARQWREPMAATILQRGDAAIALAVQNDRVVQHRAADDSGFGKIISPARDIPAIAQEHRRSSPLPAWVRPGPTRDEIHLM